MILLNKKTLIYAIILVCGFILVFFAINKIFPAASDNIQKVEIIVDAGHGLPDGGTVAADGTTEQSLNLQIASLLHQKLSENNIVSIMTRSDENGIYDDEETIRSKKVADAKKRVQICKENSDALVISIHMNAFSSASVHGCQVFYQAADPFSQNLAQLIQQNINQFLQPNQHKNSKEIPKNVYLFKNISNSAILIECGFLSNPQDVEKLKDPKYQAEMVNIIYDSLQKFKKN